MEWPFPLSNRLQSFVAPEHALPLLAILAKTNGVLSVYNELNCLRALSHSKFICRAHHAFSDSRQLYLVLEFCAGGDFRMNLRRQPRGVFSENTARFYIAQCIRKYPTAFVEELVLTS